MSKATNKSQMQHLLELMESNADIACNFHKGSKEQLARFWKNAETELNSMGPPTKCIAEWKKVCADQEKYVRQKAAQNLKNQNATGGGPNSNQKFSAMDEAIYNLIGMKTSVEGVSAKTFGITDGTNKHDLPDTAQYMDISIDELYNKAEEEISKENITPAIPVTAHSKKTSDLKKSHSSFKSSYDALEAELAIQKELLEAIKLVVSKQENLEQTTKKIYRSIDKLADVQQKHFKEMERLKKKEIEDMQRNNAYMEKLRMREVNYKLEKTQLQMQEYERLQ